MPAADLQAVLETLVQQKSDFAGATRHWQNLASRVWQRRSLAAKPWR